MRAHRDARAADDVAASGCSEPGTRGCQFAAFADRLQHAPTSAGSASSCCMFCSRNASGSMPAASASMSTICSEANVVWTARRRAQRAVLEVAVAQRQRLRDQRLLGTSYFGTRFSAFVPARPSAPASGWPISSARGRTSDVLGCRYCVLVRDDVALLVDRRPRMSVMMPGRSASSRARPSASAARRTGAPTACDISAADSRDVEAAPPLP